MKVRALTAIADGGFTTHQYGEVFETSEQNARAWLASSPPAVELVDPEPASKEPETAVSPKHEKAERAVRPAAKKGR